MVKTINPKITIPMGAFQPSIHMGGLCLWWFHTWILFSISLGWDVIRNPLTKSIIFQDGHIAPPTSRSSKIAYYPRSKESNTGIIQQRFTKPVTHQPDMSTLVMIFWIPFVPVSAHIILVSEFLRLIPTKSGFRRSRPMGYQHPK